MSLGSVRESIAVFEPELLKQIIDALGGKLQPIEGSVPDPYSHPTGCAFHPRCAELVGDVCRERVPPPEEVGTGHCVSCFRYSKAEVDC